MKRSKRAALIVAALFCITAAGAQRKDPTAWMDELGPVAGIRGRFGSGSGADACYGMDSGHYHWNGLGFRTGIRYMPEYGDIDNAVYVPLAFSWRSRLRTGQERLSAGVSGLSPYVYDTPSFMTAAGAFLLNLFSRFELFAGLTPGYVFGMGDARPEHPFGVSADAGFALSYRIWRFNIRMAPSIHYSLTDRDFPWSASLDFGLLYLF